MSSHSTRIDQLREALSSPPFALIRREGENKVDVLAGPVSEVFTLEDIPLRGPETIAMVPFRQVQERGFVAQEDNLPILCLEPETALSVPLDELVSELPGAVPDLVDLGFSLDDDEYAQVVSDVIEYEIGSGEGANFVIRRDYRAKLTSDRVQAALSWFRKLVEREGGAYWTFAFVTDQMIAVGASPERHVSGSAGKVKMNPISGTLRHAGESPSVETILTFLADRKESEELVMVVDEELKMMSEVCPEGGVMRGPFLKPMSQLTHTEYLLEGHSKLDPREILRLTMFAPTVTGSPMGNACTVIARHETSPRGYYSGVLARFQRTENGYEMDAPILIRTAFLDASGNVSVSAGATIVRHSNPNSEAAETKVKASGVLKALGLVPDSAPARSSAKTNPAVSDPRVIAALADRNSDLASFWRDEQAVGAKLTATALVVDGGDDFTGMLAHQLRHLGLDVTVASWDDVTEMSAYELVVFGPGPGSPLNEKSLRIERMRELISTRFKSGQPMLAACLSHQLLCAELGLPIEKLGRPRQGRPLRVDIDGESALLGYYNTFTAVAPNGSETPLGQLRVHSEEGTDYVHALTGRRAVSVQGHLESVLSSDGYRTLERLTRAILGE